MTQFSRFTNFSYIREDILEEHFEEVEFLWGQRDNALLAANYNLADLAKLEKRMDAHLDGLTVGGERTVFLLTPELDGDDVYRSAAAAAGLLSVESDSARASVLEAVAKGSWEMQAGIVKALGYFPLVSQVREILQDWLSSESAKELAVGWDVLSFHRTTCSADISLCTEHEHPLVRSASARAIGRLGRSEWIPLLTDLKNDEVEEVRRDAWMAAAQTGDQDLLATLRERCRPPVKASPWEIHLLALLGGIQEVEILIDHLLEPATAETGAAALACLGYTSSIPALLTAMEKPFSAAAAGVAFARITGCELPVLPPAEQSDQEEEDSFADMRPLPDAAQCKDLWLDLQNTLPSDQRLRDGAVLTDNGWLARPNEGDLLSRREEIFRLRNQQPGVLPTLELDAPAAQQQATEQEVES